MSPPARQHVVIEAEHFDQAMGMVLDRLDAIQLGQAEAMAKALRSVMTDPETIGTVMDIVAETAQERAQKATGRGVWLLVRSAFSRWLLIALIVVMVAKVAGWDVAKSVAKWLHATST